MTTDRRSNTIAGRHYPSLVKDDRYVLATGVTVTPGMILEVTGSTAQGYLEVQPHSNDGAAGVRTRIAEVRGHPPRGDGSRTPRKNQDYTEDGEMVEVVRFRQGDTTDNALLGAGEAVTEGTPLVPNGAGALRESAVDADGNYTELAATFAEAEEAVDNGAGTEPVRIEVAF